MYFYNSLIDFCIVNGQLEGPPVVTREAAPPTPSPVMTCMTPPDFTALKSNPLQKKITFE